MLSSCPFCKTEFKLYPIDERGEQRVEFSSGKRPTRTCINCSKAFESDTTEAIPTCPECLGLNQVTPKETIKPVWKVYHDGKMTELDSEASIREWIRQGNITADDHLISPDGRSMPAKRFAKFQDAFRDRARKNRDDSRPAGVPVQMRKYMRTAFYAQALSVILLSTAVAWAVYRIATYRPSANASSDPLLEGLQRQLQSRIQPSSQSPDLLYEQAANLMAQDRPASYEAARDLLEQAIALGMRSPEGIARLTEAYALAAQYGDDTRLRLTTLDLASLAIRADPARADGYIAKARASLSSSDLPAALEASRKATEINPNHPRTLLIRARVLLATAKSDNDLDQSLVAATGAISRDPSLLEGYDLVGQAYFAKGDPKSALAAFQKRLQQSPEDPLALYRRGTLENRAGNDSAAMEWYQWALRASPNIVPARLALATIYARQTNQPADAQRHLRAILSRYRRFAEPEEIFSATRELCDVLVRRGNSAEAQDLIKNLSTPATPSADLALLRANALAERDRSGSTAILEEAWNANADNPAIAFALARSYHRQNNTDRAARLYRDTIALRPHWFLPYFFLIDLFVHRNQYPEAIDAGNALVARVNSLDDSDHWHPLSESAESPPWDMFRKSFQLMLKRETASNTFSALLGILYFQRGLAERNKSFYSKALSQFEKARALDRNSPWLPLYAGRAQLALENGAAATTAFQSALKLSPANPAAQFWLGQAFAKRKKWGDAESSMKAIQEDREWGYKALAVLGDISNQRGNLMNAEGFWQKSLARNKFYMPPWRALLASSRS